MNIVEDSFICWEAANLLPKTIASANSSLNGNVISASRTEELMQFMLSQMTHVPHEYYVQLHNNAIYCSLGLLAQIFGQPMILYTQQEQETFGYFPIQYTFEDFSTSYPEFAFNTDTEPKLDIASDLTATQLPRPVSSQTEELGEIQKKPDQSKTSYPKSENDQSAKKANAESTLFKLKSSSTLKRGPNLFSDKTLTPQNNAKRSLHLQQPKRQYFWTPDASESFSYNKRIHLESITCNPASTDRTHNHVEDSDIVFADHDTKIDHQIRKLATALNTPISTPSNIFISNNQPSSLPNPRQEMPIPPRSSMRKKS